MCSRKNLLTCRIFSNIYYSESDNEFLVSELGITDFVSEANVP